MKLNKLYLLAIPFSFAISNGALAQDDVVAVDEGVNVDEVAEVTMDVSENARQGGENRRLGHEIRSIVVDYMLENGDITQEEIDAHKAEREAVREEIKALRESGDEEALAARLAELRDERATRREEMQSYIEGNEDLASAIQERRDEVQQERGDEVRQERRERRARLQD